MTVFVGIEGIGMRRSLALAADDSGRILATVPKPWGMSLHTTPRDELRSRLMELLRELSRQLGGGLEALADAVVCLGITGVTFPYDAHVDLPGEFQQVSVPVRALICTGDAEIVFASHAQDTAGGVIICHMGSTAYCAVRGQHFRFGGWGPALGDEGSGFWIGRASLRAIGEEHDTQRPPSILWEEVSKWLTDPGDDLEAWSEASLLWRRQLEDTERHKHDLRTAVLAFTHDISKASGWLWRVVASGMTIPVMRAWDRNDSAAATIVATAITELCRQFRMVLRVAGLQRPPGVVVLYGGVLTYNPRFRDALVTRLREEYGPRLPFAYPGDTGTMCPVCGALLFAIGGSTTGALRLPRRSVIDRLREEVARYNGNGFQND